MAVSGMTWTFHAGVYPRYSYFRDRLIRLYPRFQRIIENEQLQETICQGKEWLKEIQTYTEYLNGPLGITVFYDPSVDKRDLQGLTLKHFVVNCDVFKYKKPENVVTTLAKIIKDGQPSTQFHPRVIVLCVGNSYVSPSKDVLALSDVQKQNLIIFDVSTKRCERFMDGRLISKELNIQDLTTASEIQPLGKLIQEVLEAKPVGIIEDIAAYCRRFELHDVQTQSRSLIDEVNHQLSRYLYNKYVIEELGDVKDPKSQQQSTGKSDREYMDVSETHEADLLMPPTKKIKLTETSLLEDEKSFNQYTKALSRMTKCLICGYLSILYGLPQAVIAAFLSESGFDFENKCIKHMKTSSLNHWIDFEPTKKLPYQKSKFFKDTIVSSFQELLTATQEFVKAKLEVINILNKLQFEIRALLRQTNIKLKVLGEKDLARSPKLPLELQKELLLLEKVDGCGTIFGKLTLHTVEQMTDKEKKKVDELLEIHRYRHGYSIELILAGIEDHVTIEPGNALMGQGRIGSLGGFVRIKGHADDNTTSPHSDEEQNGNEMKIDDLDISASTLDQATGCNSRESNLVANVLMANKTQDIATNIEKYDEHKLYAVTSEHNFTNCSIQVKNITDPTGTSHQFGQTNPALACADGEMVDIQLIQVIGDGFNCDTRFKSPNGIPKPSYLYEGSPMSAEIEGLEVYKRGTTTQLTFGTVASSNYRKNKLAWLPNLIVSDYYNILILQNDGETFSNLGDSGSFVCRDMLNGSIAVISIINGAIKLDKTIKFINTCHLKSNLERIAENNPSIASIELESSLYSDSDNESLDDHGDQLAFDMADLKFDDTEMVDLANKKSELENRETSPDSAFGGTPDSSIEGTQDLAIEGTQDSAIGGVSPDSAIEGTQDFAYGENSDSSNRETKFALANGETSGSASAED